MSARAAPKSGVVTVNRAPVLTLWAAVVAKRLGYAWDESLTLGRAVAGLNAQSKGRRLGIFRPAAATRAAAKARSPKTGERLQVELLHRAVPCVRTPAGVRALGSDSPIEPAAVERYLRGKFGDDLAAVRGAMTRIARSRPPKDLALHAFDLYEAFRPTIPAGRKGWGAAGALDLELVRSLATRPREAR